MHDQHTEVAAALAGAINDDSTDVEQDDASVALFATHEDAWK